VDLNGDGKIDLVTGSFDGGPYFLEGLGPGRFAAPRPIMDKNGARILISSYWDHDKKEWTELEGSHYPGEHAISIITVDWDCDGDLDLLLGARSGHLFLRTNEGSAGAAAFGTHNEKVGSSEGKALIVPGGGATVEVADWNLDGKWDIVAGSSTGAVYWFRNVGTEKEPRFSEASKLVNAPSGERSPEEAALWPGTRAQVSVGDHNADGFPDLLMGDQHYRTVKGTEFTPERRDRYEALMYDLHKIDEKLESLAGGESDGKKEDPERAELEKKRQAIMKELSEIRPKSKRHGWVWLFERKPF